MVLINKIKTASVISLILLLIFHIDFISIQLKNVINTIQWKYKKFLSIDIKISSIKITGGKKNKNDIKLLIISVWKYFAKIR